MKELSFEQMERIEGGDCNLATSVVLGFWSSGIGYAFSAAGAGIGFVASVLATGVVIGVCYFAD